MSVTVSMHFVNELFRGVPEDEAAREAYLARAGISPFLLSAPHGRVTVEQFATLSPGHFGLGARRGERTAHVGAHPGAPAGR